MLKIKKRTGPFLREGKRVWLCIVMVKAFSATCKGLKQRKKVSSGLGVEKSKWLIMFIRVFFHCEHIIREGYAIEKVYVNLVYNKG